MEGRRIVGVVQAERLRDRFDSGSVHLLQGEHVGAPEVGVLAKGDDRAVDPQRVLDVERHHAPAPEPRLGRDALAAHVARPVRVQVVPGLGAGGRERERKQDQEKSGLLPQGKSGGRWPTSSTRKPAATRSCDRDEPPTSTVYSVGSTRQAWDATS